MVPVTPFIKTIVNLLVCLTPEPGRYFPARRRRFIIAAYTIQCTCEYGINARINIYDLQGFAAASYRRIYFDFYGNIRDFCDLFGLAFCM